MEDLRRIVDFRRIVLPDQKLTDESNLEVVRTNLRNEFNLIQDKVKTFSYTSTRNHKIQCSKFNTVFVMSDIHADYSKFVQTLMRNNLISFGDFIPTDVDVFDPKEIYNPQFINNAEWIGGERTLFLILGDLVDGKRGQNQVNDIVGAFELLIHCLIHNLRISAQSNFSEVLFTIGNHDLDTVLNHPDLNDPKLYLYNNYVHESSKLFFGNDPEIDKRKTVLLPFYQNSPYLFIKLMNNEKTEIVCVHAGIHMAGKNILDEGWEKIQDSMNETGYTDVIATTITDRPKDKEGNGPNILWTREYLEGCPTEKDQPIVIVGHCPTPFFDNPGTCPPGRGCVALRCKDDHEYPKVVMVDTASSKSFHADDNQARSVEILKLSKQSVLSDKFYKIERQLNGEVIGTQTTPATPGVLKTWRSLLPFMKKGGSLRKPVKHKMPRTRKRRRRIKSKKQLKR
jgi:hypothetical protein